MTELKLDAINRCNKTPVIVHSTFLNMTHRRTLFHVVRLSGAKL